MAILTKDAKVFLIGCNTYSCSPLNWCVKDCERITLELVKNGFKQQNIIAYFDEKVNFSNIWGNLEEFIKNNKEGIIYYSGHGTTDSKGNSCLVMSDFCKDDNALIRIDALYNLTKNKKFVLIFDCCYSYDSTLGRGLQGDLRDEPKERYMPFNISHIVNSKKLPKPQKQSKALIVSSKSKSTFLFASQSDHVANEGIVEIVDNKQIGGGFFSYALSKVINQPLSKIHDATLNYLNKVSNGQMPVIVSNNMNETLF
jgi:hypothetical protein